MTTLAQVPKWSVIVGFLAAAAGLWAGLKEVTGVSSPSEALVLAKDYLGLTTSLADVFGIAIGTGTMLKATSAEDGKTAAVATFGGIAVVLAGGTMIGTESAWAPAAALAGLVVSGSIAYAISKR